MREAHALFSIVVRQPQKVKEAPNSALLSEPGKSGKGGKAAGGAAK